MITTNYNQKDGILETVFEGNISLEEVLNYITLSDFDLEMPGTLKILSDSRKAKFSVDPENLEAVVEATKNITDYHPYIIDAVIVDDPMDIALLMLYEKISPVKKYKVKVFSTPESARAWLNSF